MSASPQQAGTHHDHAYNCMECVCTSTLHYLQSVHTEVCTLPSSQSQLLNASISMSNTLDFISRFITQNIAEIDRKIDGLYIEAQNLRECVYGESLNTRSVISNKLEELEIRTEKRLTQLEENQAKFFDNILQIVASQNPTAPQTTAVSLSTKDYPPLRTKTLSSQVSQQSLNPGVRSPAELNPQKSTNSSPSKVICVVHNLTGRFEDICPILNRDTPKRNILFVSFFTFL